MAVRHEVAGRITLAAALAFSLGACASAEQKPSLEPQLEIEQENQTPSSAEPTGQPNNNEASNNTINAISDILESHAIPLESLTSEQIDQLSDAFVRESGPITIATLAAKFGNCLPIALETPSSIGEAISDAPNTSIIEVGEVGWVEKIDSLANDMDTEALTEYMAEVFSDYPEDPETAAAIIRDKIDCPKVIVTLE